MSSSSSSRRWIERQLRDPFVKAAAQDGYRARSAYKLIEMDRRFGLIAPGSVVVDCGAAPGAWTQVAAAKTGERGVVVACDLLHMEPVNGAFLLPANSDFTDKLTQQKVLALLGGRQPDLVMSDMAPNASGNSDLDHDAIVNLQYSALRFALTTSRPGAAFLCKLWSGGSQGRLEKDLARFYEKVKASKPQSSRKESAELYLVARGFKGLEKTC